MTGDAIRGNLPPHPLYRHHSVPGGTFPPLMAADAVAHREGLQGARGRAVEGFHRTMAGLGLHPRRHMNPVREEDVRSEPPDTAPWDLLPPFPEGLQLL